MEITLGHCQACADTLGIRPELVQTVASVESQGDASAFLFEPHVFSRLTNHKYDETRPDLSWPKWDKSRYLKHKEDRLIQFGKAVFLEPLKAYESASWGLFQIMGFHYKVCGYGSALAMSQELQSNVEANVAAFGFIIRDMHLVDTLKAMEWEKFAKIYNGPGYKLNNYHIKMQNAYDRITDSQKS